MREFDGVAGFLNLQRFVEDKGDDITVINIQHEPPPSFGFQGETYIVYYYENV